MTEKKRKLKNKITPYLLFVIGIQFILSHLELRAKLKTQNCTDQLNQGTVTQTSVKLYPVPMANLLARHLNPVLCL